MPFHCGLQSRDARADSNALVGHAARPARPYVPKISATCEIQKLRSPTRVHTNVPRQQAQFASLPGLAVKICVEFAATALDTG